VSDKTGIEWTDATWNPTTGCDKVSPGCDHCYAMTLAPRLKAMGSPRYQNDGNPKTSGPGFGFTMHPDALDQPLRWKRPRRIFVNSMSDLFHSDMKVAFLADVFAVMALAEQHTFQVLTKRPGRMATILKAPAFRYAVAESAARRVDEPPFDPCPTFDRIADGPGWPLPNVWLGTSLEDQKRADLRLAALFDTPAAVRFLSCEPLLGPVHLQQALNGDRAGWRHVSALDWVIVGGESGPGARPMRVEWARSLRDECAAAGVAFHFKQWGSHDEHGTPMHKKAAGRELDGRTWDEYPQTLSGVSA